MHLLRGFVPRIVATLHILPSLRQSLLANTPRLHLGQAIVPGAVGGISSPLSSSLTRSLSYSTPLAAMSSAAAAAEPSPDPSTTSSTAAEPATPRSTSPDAAESSSSQAKSEPAAKQPETSDKTEAKEPPADEPKLPPLTPAEFRQYNRMAETMDYFHNHFRSTWNMMYNACTTGKRPGHLSLKAFINEGLQFIQHLTMHHDIEESYFFPMLARKMPEFQMGKEGKGRKGKGDEGLAELLRQHREIHKGMDAFEAYLKECKRGERELELSVLKEQMDTWGKILWTHLDQEVKTLGAENMRKYWTMDEIRRMHV